MQEINNKKEDYRLRLAELNKYMKEREIHT